MGEIGNSNIVSITLPHLKDLRKGTTAETYKYLHGLIKGKNIENLSELLTEETTLPQFEQSLQLMIIDCLHLDKEVVKIFLSQNDYKVKKILNCKWFFQNLSAEFCIEKLFPYVSQSLRCKIINRLSKHLNNSDEAEKYFAFIKENYSNARAHFLLPRCSSEFILKYFKETKKTFEEGSHIKILFNICRRYPEEGIQILSGIFERKNKPSDHTYPYGNILSYLSGHYPDLMVPFIKKHQKALMPNVFGKKLTRKFVRKLDNFSFPDFEVSRIFREPHFTSMLPLERKIDFAVAEVRSLCTGEKAKLTLTNWSYSEQLLCRLLKSIPQDQRASFIERVFKEVYNKNYFETTHAWSEKILQLLPCSSRNRYVEKLEKFLSARPSEIRKNFEPEFFSLEHPVSIISLFPSSRAFQIFKEKLRKTSSVSIRESILVYMVLNCSINDDVKALEEVVEFVSTRHRNDTPRAIYSFLETICNNFPATKLSSTIFEKLDNLANFFIMKGHRDDQVYRGLKELHIFYLLDKGLDVSTHVKNVFKLTILDQFHGIPFVRDLRSKHSKTLILALCLEAIDAIREKPEDEGSKDLLSALLLTCSMFNKRNGREKINLRDIPGLNDILKKELKNNFGDAGGDTWSLDIWERYYEDLLNADYKPRHLLYSLKRNPALIEKNMNGILNILFDGYCREYNSFFNYLTMMVSFFKKTDHFKEMILKEFQSQASVHRRKKALMLYSRVCTLEEFSTAIDEYLPKREQIEEQSDFNEIQISIPPLIKNVRPRWRNLELTVKFFWGDFLKSVLTSFYACCHHTRCDVAIPFLKHLLNDVPQKVSYKKEVIRLILQLSDRKGRLDFCSNEWKEEVHYSIRQVLLRDISQLFLEKPSKELFEALKKCILESHEEVIEASPPLTEMPEKFWNDYFSALWQFSEDKRLYFKTNFRRSLLWNFDINNIKLISKDLCRSVIENELFDPSSDTEVDRFTALCLGNSEVSCGAEMVFELMRSRKADSASIGSFFRILMNESWDHSSRFRDEFSKNLWQNLSKEVPYSLRTLLKYHIDYQKVLWKYTNHKEGLVEFGKQLHYAYMNESNLAYLIPIYSEVLLVFLKRFQTDEAIIMLRELLNGYDDISIVLLVVKSLPEDAVQLYRTKDDVFDETMANNKKLVTELVKSLKNYNNDIINIYLSEKLAPSEITSPDE